MIPSIASKVVSAAARYFQSTRRTITRADKLQAAAKRVECLVDSIKRKVATHVESAITIYDFPPVMRICGETNQRTTFASVTGDPLNVGFVNVSK